LTRFPNRRPPSLRSDRRWLVPAALGNIRGVVIVSLLDDGQAPAGEAGED